jgi:hypothetical protein
MNQTTTMLDAAVLPPIAPPTPTSSFFQDLDKLKVDVLAAALDGAVTELSTTLEVKKIRTAPRRSRSSWPKSGSRWQFSTTS